MHEYSIVQALLNSCEESARENGLDLITKVVVKIGVLSGVEPDLFITAFDTFKLHTICHNAMLEIIYQPVEIECRSCGIRSILKKNEFACISCGSIDIDVVDGEDIYLMSLEMD